MVVNSENVVNGLEILVAGVGVAKELLEPSYWRPVQLEQ